MTMATGTNDHQAAAKFRRSSAESSCANHQKDSGDGGEINGCPDRVISREDDGFGPTGHREKRPVVIDVEKLGFLLRVYGITINDLAKEMGFDRSYLSKAIHGRVEPSVRFLTRLAHAIETFGQKRRVDSSMFVTFANDSELPTGCDGEEPSGGSDGRQDVSRASDD